MPQVKWHNVDAEKRLLSILVNNPEIYTDIRDRIEAGDFFSGNGETPNLRKIYETLVDSVESRESLTPLSLAAKSGFSSDTWKWLVNLDAPVNELDSLVKLVQDERVRRDILQMGTRLTALAQESNGQVEDVIERAEDVALKLRTLQRHSPVEPARVREVGARYLEEMERNRGIDPEQRYVSTPFIDINRLMGGLLRQRLSLVGARPGMGKSSMLADFREHACSSGMRVVSYMMEMSEEQVINRYVSKKTGLTMQELTKFSYLGDVEKEARIYAVVAEVTGWDWYFFDTIQTARNVRKIRQTAHSVYSSAGGIDLIDIDYMQLLRLDGRSDRVKEIDDIAYMLVDVSKETNSHVVVASQLNRNVEARQDKRPQLSDLRDSGGLEQAADNVIFIYRDEYYNPETERPNIAEIDLAKHRDGATGVIDLYWRAKKMSFANLKIDEGRLL